MTAQDPNEQARKARQDKRRADTVRYRRGGTTYVIRVENPLRISSGAVDIDVDGTRVAGDRFAAPDDGAEHRVDVRIRDAALADTTAAADAADVRVAAARL